MGNYKVIGMTCVVCATSVEKAVRSVEGVTDCQVNLLTGSMTVEGTAAPELIIRAVKGAGYKARLDNDMDKVQISDKADEISDSEMSQNIDDSEDGNSIEAFKIIRNNLIVSIVLLLILMYFSTLYRVFDYNLPSLFEDNSYLLYGIQIILSLAVMIIYRQFFISGFKSLIHRAPNMDALVSLGSLSAFLYSAIVSVRSIYYYGNMREYIGRTDIYFETSAMILVMVSAGKLVEELAKGKTTGALKGLMNLSPKTAIILTPEGEKEVGIEQVMVGDIFILKPGMSVPVDGIVESGHSAVDESSLTGESIPVDKMPGMEVSAATINMSGHLTCRATKVGDNTAFSHIVQMVKDASNGKTRFERTSDKVSGTLISIVILIAIATFACWMFTDMGFGFALSRAIAVLIISTPCAIGLATPVTVMVGNSIGARHGILFKTAEALENTGKTEIVVVDKTGTITTGEPKVTDIISTVNDMEHRDLLLTIAYSLESKSEHPLAKAICEYAQKRYVNPLPTSNFYTSPGKGIMADIRLGRENHRIYAGNEAYIAEMLLGIKDENSDVRVAFKSDFSDVIKNLVDSGKTPLIFASINGILGVIAVADEINETSSEAVKQFHKDEIHVVMVTGDRYATAKAVGEQIGIGKDEVMSEVLPQDKADIVKHLKEIGRVAMIGDGINDAPALTVADTGIAIGAGTDVAIDAADVVLVQNNLISAVTAIKLSRATAGIISQNLFWALIYNIIGIPLAAGCFYTSFGWLLDPVFCAAMMTISSIIVILNALRLFRFKPADVKSGTA